MGIPVSTFKRWAYWVAHNPGYMASPVDEAEETIETVPEAAEEFNLETKSVEEVEVEVEAAQEALIEAPGPEQAETPPRPLQTVRNSSPEFVIEVAGAGHRVKVPTGFDADELRRLLRALS